MYAKHLVSFKAMIMFLLLHSHLPHTVRELPFPVEAENTANKYMQFCGKKKRERRGDGKKCVACRNMSVSVKTMPHFNA